MVGGRDGCIAANDLDGGGVLVVDISGDIDDVGLGIELVIQKIDLKAFLFPRTDPRDVFFRKLAAVGVGQAGGLGKIENVVGHGFDSLNLGDAVEQAFYRAFDERSVVMEIDG